jgi:alcohol dehydrogenase class IV
MRLTKKPFAILVRKGSFEKYEPQCPAVSEFELSREKTIQFVVKQLGENDVIVSTTGHISRELYQYRDNTGGIHKRDFLTVGSMGHASSIASAIAMVKPHRKIVCFDGDGACLMHMGAIPVIASLHLHNFKHIVFNNLAHDSVGGQPNASRMINYTNLVIACGYKNAYSVKTLDELGKILPGFLNEIGPGFLEIKVKCGARNDLCRPKETPVENKKVFAGFLNDNVSIGAGSINKLSKILKNYKKILIFAGKKSFENSKDVIAGSLKCFDITIYSDFSTNPNDTDMKKAVKKLQNNKYDAIVAIGGGSVIDFAKIFKFTLKSSAFLIAVPTTAGTGSEATRFAVFYVNGKKTSVEDTSILPDYAIIDSKLLRNSPRYLRASTAFDALAQSIESFWSINSNNESMDYAMQSMQLCKDNIIDYVNSNTEISAEKMSVASYLSGKAINISKTTAPHALSYAFSIKYGIPHGHAVALSFANIFEMNINTSETNSNDKRGIEYVKSITGQLSRILNKNYFTNLFKQIGLETNVKLLNINNISEIVQEVNLDRLKNNPRKFDSTELENAFL